MGASLDTPTKCPLCSELTREPVTLKCHHRFCQRCIGDLWSICPAGPFRCPEWRCKTSYNTLPFDSSLLWPPNTSRRASNPSSPGTSSKAPNTSDSPLTRPSLASRLLGKRKASTPVPEQPDTKRPATCDRSDDIQTAVNSASDTAGDLHGVEATSNGVNSESKQSGSDDTGDSVMQHTSDVSQGSPHQHEAAEWVDTDDPSDCCTEVESCDAPLLANPQVTENHALPRKPTSPANKSFPTASISQKSVSPVSKSAPHMSPKNAAETSGSPSRIGIFSKPESRNNSPVQCHYCPKTVQRLAVKTCLVCGASMCTEHLRPHMESPVFQSHSLVPPTVDISLWRCQEHQEINRIYCRQCAACVCTVCTVIGSHRNHVCISIRDAERELRGNLIEEIKQLQVTEQQVRERVTEFTQMKEKFKALLSDSRAGVQQQYTAIIEALQQEEQSALQCVEKEESRVVGGLEEKLGHLQNSLQSIQQGLHTLEALADDGKEGKLIKDQAFILEYSKVEQLDVASCMDQLDAPEEVDEARLKCLQTWTEKRLDKVVITDPSKDKELYKLLYGTMPTLDADTAHPKLQLSDSNRRVTYTDAQQVYTEQESRFSAFPQVLACHALEGGRCYWEVDVSVDEGRWKVGLCEGRMERKGQRDSSCLGFNLSSWCLACDRRKLQVLHNKAPIPVTADRLQRVVFVLSRLKWVC
ncbi:tripartite motif-containing protein 16 isoform X3 [Dunckerocampus dactyliophorus]|uniref:tripartite motif-containing protein 16 isoform X3 n=1 Tax=Dunckerocampus dactyliophorus TaxID=161453 RepID=UPI002405E2C8|nr:tripartite motif-containing protein 16 isoform X3 [Dunckerocampus dactyliophorus]